jgi:hypothetical protein
MQCSDYFFFSTLIAVIIISTVNSLVLLSDVPTPSFIIDVQALRRSVVAEPLPIINDDKEAIPSIRCPKNNLLLHPIFISDNNNNNDDEQCRSNFKKNKVVIDCNFPIIEGQPAIGYLHSTVTRGRDDAIANQDDPLSTFLAEIDLDTTLCGGDGSAHLVLGLNNHHVGSYYWARSAGAGSSMEAPGVWYGRNSNSSNSNSNNNKGNMGGVLRWLDDNGPTECNSNDGKRSEWVNFLRKGDTVQLLPSDGQDAILEFHNRYGDGVESDASSTRIFGISNEGRPMGSEPRIVCEWRCTYEV